MTARIVRRVQLHYMAGADAMLDRSAHVRAASGLVWIGERLAVVQDDSNFIALVDPDTGLAEAVTLPPGAGGKRLFDDARGNKADKHDFESLLSATRPDGSAVLLAFGSGSTLSRQHIARVHLGAETRVQIVDAHQLYRALRECGAFAGSELNIEGAIRIGDVVRLFGRGNGALAEGVQRVNATCDINWTGLLDYLENPADVLPPQPSDVVQFALGDIAQTRITFTDAATIGMLPAPQNASVLYTGTAEDSADAVQDGPVAGSVLGVISTDAAGWRARWTAIRDGNDTLQRAKVEGVVVGDTACGQVFVVVDADDHQLPSELWELEVRGISW